MTWSVIAFSALSLLALYEMLSLRQRVFVVEQRCAYLDCDGKDDVSLHLFGRDTSHRLVAYARLVPPLVSFAEASIGRVLTHESVRRTGAGKALMKIAVDETRKAFGAGPIRIGAQVYLTRFYGDLGFVASGSEYDEDGIPHVEMRLA